VSIPDERTPRDQAQLSAYLDSRLPEKERRKIEARLQAEPELARDLEELRRTIMALRSLPQVRVPRSFTLTPEMAGIRRSAAGYPALQLATALAALALVVVTGIDLAGLSAPTDLPAGEEAPAALEAEAPREMVPLIEEEPVGGMGGGGADAPPQVMGTPSPGQAETEPLPAELATGEALMQDQVFAGTAESVTPEATEAEAEPPMLAMRPPEDEVGKLAEEQPALEQGGVSPLRMLELGLGLLVVALAVATLRMRPRGA
jgi:hypothetical protein